METVRQAAEVTGRVVPGFKICKKMLKTQGTRNPKVIFQVRTVCLLSNFLFCTGDRLKLESEVVY